VLRLILPIVFLIIGVAGGVGAGFMFAPVHDEAMPDMTDPSADTVSGRAMTGENSDTPDSSSARTEFVRLNSQFVVPIVHMGSVRSLVVLALSVEVPVGESDAVFAREPRLRDAFLQVMFAHANAGGFDGSFTEAAAMAPLRRSLREAARTTLGDVALDVLIVDIARQDA